MSDSVNEVVRLIQGAPQPAIPGARPRPGDQQRGPVNPWQARDKAMLELAALVGEVEAVSGISMNVQGLLSSVMLPLGNLGSELASDAATLTRFFGRRGTAGIAGTTKVELEKNGVPTGFVLEWISTDANFALEQTEIKLKVVEGDRLSLRLLSAEAGAQDLFCIATI